MKVTDVQMKNRYFQFTAGTREREIIPPPIQSNFMHSNGKKDN